MAVVTAERNLVGQRVRALREARGESQRQVERDGGLAGGYISRVENSGDRDMTLSALRRIASALGTRPAPLLDPNAEGPWSPASPPVAEFAARLREARKRRGLLQREVSERCGFGPMTIRNFEAGRRSPFVSSLLLVADALDVPVAWLLGDPDAVAPWDA